MRKGATEQLRVAAQIGVQMATVHTLGGRAMMAGAAREAAGDPAAAWRAYQEVLV